MPWTYLLRCSDDTYYAGSTWDIEGRVWQHQNGELGAVYTRKRRPIALVWCTWFDRIEDAFAFEKQIQGWSRKKREALIAGAWDALPNLSRRLSVQQRLAEHANARPEEPHPDG
ncbi:GIY-YIG nuclease family protein [Nocardioides sp. SLBN-35]|jgi:putative endonuclease|uniref:GIY-YIG nuclease family protein n=1 Tax=Nocardioides sp. SLBN-35 TaxID=2768445 RepID=UPI00114E68CF|nr:GIY-YIG nuclease family protein [Nocardioides sp. SLBN-35]TQK71618.1 putative endonuclease [Nocardioides sp. SLBN-35]